MVVDLNDRPAPLPPLPAIPADLASLSEYERRAAAHVPAATWRHIQEGSGDEITLRDNRAQFDRWRLLPRAFAEMSDGSTATILPDGEHAAPILLAPVAYERLAHPDGELAAIRASTALGLGMVVSTLASVTLEEIATARSQAADELGRAPAPLWFQLYLQPRRDDSLSLVRRAERAGYQTIVLTIDASVKPSGFPLPAGVDAVNLAGFDRPRQVATAGGKILFGTPLVDAAPRWDDLAWLRETTELPMLVKGMMTGEDAEKVIAAGANGLILSNHGGRVLDSLPAPLDVLGDLADRVDGRVPILVDGGFRRGTDIVKALCLGARGVLIGRPVLHGLAVAGMPGAAHVLHLLRTELELAMAQLGCATVEELTGRRIVAAG